MFVDKSLMIKHLRIANEKKQIKDDLFKSDNLTKPKIYSNLINIRYCKSRGATYIFYDNVR